MEASTTRSHDTTLRDLALSLSKASLEPSNNAPTSESSESNSSSDSDPDSGSGSGSNDAPLLLTQSESLASAILNTVLDIRKMLSDDDDARRDSSGSGVKDEDDGWTALMDAVVSKTNDLISAQIVLENDPSLKARNPPLFWLLYSGHE